MMKHAILFDSQSDSVKVAIDTTLDAIHPVTYQYYLVFVF